MRRYVPLLIAGAALIAAACSDSTAPTRLTADSNLPVAVAAFGGGPASFAKHANDNNEDNGQSIQFKLSPDGGTVNFGSFTLTYPANAVCDPDRSDYGPSEWKKPCATLDESIKMKAKFWTEDGRTHADFSPDIRFDPSKNVVISVYLPQIKGSSRTPAELNSKYSIWYSARQGSTRYFIDDASVDPTLATLFNTETGWASRKIDHFSGYYVRSGRYCEDGDPDPECLIDAILY